MLVSVLHQFVDFCFFKAPHDDRNCNTIVHVYVRIDAWISYFGLVSLIIGACCSDHVFSLHFIFLNFSSFLICLVS